MKVFFFLLHMKMTQAAERVLNSCSEENTMKVKFWGNAPVGVYKYKYPKDVQDKLGAQGAKVSC